MVMRLLAVSLQGNFGPSLTAQTALTAIKMYKIFLLKQLFKKLRFSRPVAAIAIYIIDLGFLANFLFEVV